MMDSTVNKVENQTWNNSYLLNIPMIDKQHMYFFKLFDQLLLLNKELDNDALLKIAIEDLVKYTHNHFNTEEALMQKAGITDLDLHIVQHQIFIQKVEDFKVAHDYKNALLLEQMIVFMRKWFLMHISEVDGKYAEPVQQYLEKREKNK